MTDTNKTPRDELSALRERIEKLETGQPGGYANAPYTPPAHPSNWMGRQPALPSPSSYFNDDELLCLFYHAREKFEQNKNEFSQKFEWFFADIPGDSSPTAEVLQAKAAAIGSSPIALIFNVLRKTIQRPEEIPTRGNFPRVDWPAHLENLFIGIEKIFVAPEGDLSVNRIVRALSGMHIAHSKAPLHAAIQKETFSRDGERGNIIRALSCISAIMDAQINNTRTYFRLEQPLCNLDAITPNEAVSVFVDIIENKAVEYLVKE